MFTGLHHPFVRDLMQIMEEEGPGVFVTYNDVMYRQVDRR